MKKRLHSYRRSSLLAVLMTLLLIGVTVLAAYATGGAEKGEGESRNWLDFIWRIVNFILLVWLLWWLLAERVRAYFSGRRTAIKESLENAAAAKAGAERKFAEYSAKIDKASEEITGIIDIIKAQGLAEKEKILAEAHLEAQKIREDTQARMEQEFKKAKNNLRLEAVQLSVQMAEEIIKRNIQPEDHKRMVTDFLDKVVRKH